MDTVTEDITEIDDTIFVRVQRSTKRKASDETIDLTSHATAKVYQAVNIKETFQTT